MEGSQQVASQEEGGAFQRRKSQLGPDTMCGRRKVKKAPPQQFPGCMVDAEPSKVLVYRCETTKNSAVLGFWPDGLRAMEAKQKSQLLENSRG